MYPLRTPVGASVFGGAKGLSQVQIAILEQATQEFA